MVNESNILDFSQTIFSGLVLIISAGLTAHIFHGYNSKKWRTTFIGLLLVLLIGTQGFFLLRAMLHIPTYPYQYDSTLLRHDCLDSGKGGKRSRGSTEAYDLNPCYSFNISKTTNISYDQYIPETRNCHGGFGGECTQLEPCDPCERESLPLWASASASASGGGARCRTCSASFRGDCLFVPGVGPYCREAPGSKVVVACKRCCTDGSPLFVNDTCY